MRLSSSIVLVTGGARRVGRAIAEELGGAGATVVIHCHDSSDEGVELQGRLPGSSLIRADLRTAAGCAALLDEVRTRHGRLDLLVNNAAAYERGPFLEEPDARWEEMLSLNLVAPARLTRGAVRLGLSAVVNLVDVAAWQPWKNHAAYAASKAGLLHLTRCLALELAPSVRVNGVAPGTVAFPESFSEEARASILRRIPLGRVGAPGDVARAVRFLAEEEFLTGAILPVDGGAALA